MPLIRSDLKTYMGRMEQDIEKPLTAPRVGIQGFSPFGCFLAASGAGVLTLCLLGAAAAATSWAISRLFGGSDMLLNVLLVVTGIPVVLATLWMGTRSWHIERRLATGQNVDTPVFKLMHYFRK